MYRSTRDVLLSVLTFPLPSESCPVDDSPSSAGPDVELWHADVVVLASVGLLRYLFGGRVVPGAFLSIHCSRSYNVLFGSTRHEHLKCSVSFIFWEPWHNRTETYSTLTKLFLHNAHLPMTWRKEKVKNLHWSWSKWFTCIYTKSSFVAILYLLCRNYQCICKHKGSTRVILNFEASAMFNKRVINIWNVCVFKCTEHI